MRKLFVGVSDAVCNVDLASGGPLHVLDHLGRHFEPFEPLLGHGVLDGLQVETNFLFVWHMPSCLLVDLPNTGGGKIH
jgi:hypothetical protein